MIGCHLIDGAGHWVQQEQPAEVSRLLLAFLRAGCQRLIDPITAISVKSIRSDHLRPASHAQRAS